MPCRRFWRRRRRGSISRTRATTVISCRRTMGRVQAHYLMDMMGQVVHQWDGYAAGVKANSRSRASSPRSPRTARSGRAGYIQDWDGNVLWEFYPPRDVGISVADMPFHHDMKRIWNKKLNQWTQLIVSNRNMTKAEADGRGGGSQRNSAAYGNPSQCDRLHHRSQHGQEDRLGMGFHGSHLSEQEPGLAPLRRRSQGRPGEVRRPLDDG